MPLTQGAYLYDVIIFSDDRPSHVQRLQAVLNFIREAGLTANLKKCRFAFSETQCLGYSMGQGWVKPQEKEVEVIQQYPRPTTLKQVQAFFGASRVLKEVYSTVCHSRYTPHRTH